MIFKDKSILITGGTGSFGRHFARTLLKGDRPARLVVYSRDEAKQQEMVEDFPEKIMRYFVGDVRDLDRLKMAMRGVDYVVHAAALKNITSSEYNPTECIRTNIHGAENVINAALHCGVKKVLALSSDKASNPISLYGATKLAADKLFVAGNNIAGGRSAFAVVRYGDVIGARGSIVEKYQKLLRNRALEFPVPDERMTRFFLGLDTSVKFVMKCFERMKGGEIFIPKMPSMKITDLVKTLSGGSSIKFTGMPPGEKLHEVLCSQDDGRFALEFHDHFIIRPAILFSEELDYRVNEVGERGQAVAEGFNYSSGANPMWLTSEQLLQMFA